MAEIVNLRHVRKAKARNDAARTAEANRLVFGQTKAEKAAARAVRERADRLLDGAKRED